MLNEIEDIIERKRMTATATTVLLPFCAHLFNRKQGGRKKIQWRWCRRNVKWKANEKKNSTATHCKLKSTLCFHQQFNRKTERIDEQPRSYKIRASWLMTVWSICSRTSYIMFSLPLRLNDRIGNAAIILPFSWLIDKTCIENAQSTKKTHRHMEENYMLCD